MDENILNDLMFASAVHQDIGALVLMANGCESQLDAISQRDWVDPNASRWENKQNMKSLGGAINKYRETYTELMILGLSRAVENAVGHLNEQRTTPFDIWSTPSTPIKFHDDVKILRNLGNVIKHNGSYINTSTASKAALTLVNVNGIPDHTKIGLAWGFQGLGVPSDMFENIYRVETFCFHLNALEGGCRDMTRDLTDTSEIKIYLVDRYLSHILGFSHSSEKKAEP